MIKQVAFVFDGTKYITLIGAGDFMAGKKITPESNVGYYDMCSSAGTSVLFNREFGMYPHDVPVLTKMSVCKQDEKGAFIVHGSYPEGDEMRDVSVSKDKVVFHKNRKEREAEAEQLRREHEEKIAEQETPPQPSLADFNDEDILKVDLGQEQEQENIPEPPTTDVTQAVTPEPESEPVVKNKTIGRKKRKKSGISFGPVIAQPIVEAPVVQGENVLANFPGNKPTKSEKDAPIKLTADQEESYPVKVTENDVEIVHEDPLRRLATGVSAMEALTGQRDADLVASNDVIDKLVADKLDKLNSVPMSMLQMTAAFVPHRSGINFDELGTEGIDYVRAHQWENENDWFCCDILDSATRIFYNAKTNETFEFKSSECSAVYEKRRILAEEA